MNPVINQSHISGKLFEFIEILRDANITISADEVIALFNAVTEIELEEKNIFRQTLKTTLVKDYTDIPVFDRCFDEYFSSRQRFFDGMDSDDLINFTDRVSNNVVNEIDSQLEKFIDSLDPAILLEKSAEEIMQMFLDDLPESDSSGGGEGMGIFRSRGGATGSYYSRSESGETDQKNMDEILAIIKNMINLKITRRNIGKTLKNREDFLLNKFIYQLTPQEIKEMREIVNRFGQKLKSRISLRKKRVKHGGIDIKRTFRTNLQYGGVPFKLFYKTKKIDRPQLVVMVDVSRSVNQYSRFMLLLTYSLQSLFSKVRTFAFISNMVEITDLFREMDPERAINSMFTDINFTYGWGSNYGRCFDQFIENHSDALTRKTSVLILGDARNNDNDPGLDSFQKIHDKTRNVFWLNPDKKHLWDWNDSLASLYGYYCKEMKEVNNFLDLSGFIDKLFIDTK
ncbi:MAG TPA: VWA domain-containing protein [Spirochaetota bacterium]|mgnify:CR=1 FL=1|nr:VWA domain-containing protein [Spirochaetota bacterium]HPS86714.1 VWA domain-containing protein [Spirochaetota bacterium]